MVYSGDEAISFAINSAFLSDWEHGKPPDLSDVLDTAQKRCKQLTNVGKLLVSDSDKSETAQAFLIKKAFKGMAYVYNRVLEENASAEEKSERLQEEIDLGFASFKVPNRGKLSSEETIIKAFAHLVQSFDMPWLIRYLGVQKREAKTSTENISYHVLPLFGLNKHVQQPLASSRFLDTVRSEIRLFLNTETPETLDAIEEQFKKETGKPFATITAMFEGSNYLNNAYLGRFFVLALSNLLSSSSHQIDLKSGHPLTTENCLERCFHHQIFINALLDTNKPPFLPNKTKEDKRTIDFVRSVDLLMRDLRYAYAAEQLHELNLQNLINSAHSSLDIFTKSLFTLLYRRYDDTEAKYLPDETAAAALENHMATMRRLLKEDDALFIPFREYASEVGNIAFLNQEVTTLMDVLIVFCHLPYVHRKSIRQILKKKLNEEGHEDEWSSQMACKLKSFDKRFIRPVEFSGAIYKGTHPFDSRHFFEKIKKVRHEDQQKALLTGQKLIPFLALLMETRPASRYALHADTSTNYEYLDRDYLNPDIILKRTCHQQIQAINAEAEKNNTRSISSFIYEVGVQNPKVDVLPEQHTLMRKLTQLLDAVFKMYQRLSQNPRYHAFFIKCLDLIRNKYLELGHVIIQPEEMPEGEAALDELDEDLPDTEYVRRGTNRHIQGILLPMKVDLSKNFEDFQQAANDSKRIITDPEFMERKRENFVAEIEFIHDRFGDLFHQDSKLLRLISRKKKSIEPEERLDNLVPLPRSQSMSRGSSQEDKSALKKNELETLMENAYKAMSYWSKSDTANKGGILSQLIIEVNSKKAIDDAALEQYLLKVFRIAACYRVSSWCSLIHAPYAETDTMLKAILPAIKNPRINKILPFSRVILGDERCDLALLSDEEIISKIRQKAMDETWEISDDELCEENFLEVLSPRSCIEPNDELRRHQYGSLSLFQRLGSMNNIHTHRELGTSRSLELFRATPSASSESKEGESKEEERSESLERSVTA